MGISKSLEKADYLQPLFQNLRSYVDKIKREDALRRMIQALGDFESKTTQLRKGTPTGVEDTTQQDPQQFMKNAAGDRGDFIESILPDLEFLDPNQVNLGLNTIDSLIKSNQPVQKKTKYEKFGKNVYSPGPTGEIDFEKPEYTIPEDKDKKPVEQLIYEDENERVYGYESPEGNREYNGKKYIVTKETDKRKKTGKEDSKPDYSKLIGDVNKGVSEIKTLSSTAKFGDGKVTFTSGADQFEMTLPQYKAFKEQIKNKYKDSAIELLNQQGLDDAVEDVRQLLETEGDIEKALKKFQELNPDEFDAEDIRILRDYFSLMTL